MKIIMLETRQGSDNAFAVKLYESGKTYEVGREMGCRFIRNGWATEVESQASQLFGGLVEANAEFDRIFRPQPTRGTAPTNPATLAVLGGLDGDAI